MSEQLTPRQQEIQEEVQAVIRVLEHLEAKVADHEDEWRHYHGHDLNWVFLAIHPWKPEVKGIEVAALAHLSENQLRARLKKAVQEGLAVSFKRYGNSVMYLTAETKAKKNDYEARKEAKLQAFRDRLEAVNKKLSAHGYKAQFEGGWKPKPSESLVIPMEALEKILG